MKKLTNIYGNIKKLFKSVIFIFSVLLLVVTVFASSGGNDYEKKFITNLLIRAGYSDSLIIEIAGMPRELVTYDADSGFVINRNYTHVIRDKEGNPVAGIMVELKDITFEKNIEFLFNLIEERKQQKH